MRRIPFFCTLLLFLLAPFHAFLITWFRHLGLSGGVDFAVSAWREILLILLFLLALPQIVATLQHKESRQEFLKKYGWMVIFILTPLVFLPFQLDEFKQWLWGVRFDIPLFAAFLIFSFLSFSDKQKSWLLRLFLGVGFLVLLFGVIHAMLLPQDALIPFGYSVNRDIWDISTSISSCQFLEHTQKFCRAIATFGGPSRFGTYLLLVIGVGTFKLLETKSIKEKYILSALLLLGLVNLLFTFSRSVWVGFFVAVVISLIIVARRKTIPVPWLKIGVTLLLLILVFVFFTYDSLRTIFIRASSSGEHFTRFKEGLEGLQAHPLGLGLGHAGPASLRFEKFITENWYLQIALEMGVVGLLIFLKALFDLLRLLYRSISGNNLAFGLFFTLIGISVAGLFTHSFEETTTIILFGALAGMLRET